MLIRTYRIFVNSNLMSDLFLFEEATIEIKHEAKIANIFNENKKYIE